MSSRSIQEMHELTALPFSVFLILPSLVNFIFVTVASLTRAGSKRNTGNDLVPFIWHGTSCKRNFKIQQLFPGSSNEFEKKRATDEWTFDSSSFISKVGFVYSRDKIPVATLNTKKPQVKVVSSTDNQIFFILLELSPCSKCQHIFCVHIIFLAKYFPTY